MVPQKFLPTPQLERYLERCSTRLVDIVHEIRSLVASVAPQASETILWNDLFYYSEDLGGPIKGAVCQISIHPDHIRLGFVRGAFLPDPMHLLEGQGKGKRFLRIFDYETAPWHDIEDLISSSSRLDPYTLKIR